MMASPRESFFPLLLTCALQVLAFPELEGDKRLLSSTSTSLSAAVQCSAKPAGHMVDQPQTNSSQSLDYPDRQSAASLVQKQEEQVLPPCAAPDKARQSSWIC